MRGHVTERRPGVWRIVVSDGFDAAGKRRQATRTVRGTKRDADRELTKILRERDEGRLADGRQTLERFLLEEWLPATAAVSKRGRPLAPTTKQRYRDACRRVVAVIGKVRLVDIRLLPCRTCPRPVARRRPRAADGLRCPPRPGPGAPPRRGSRAHRSGPGRRARSYIDRPGRRRPSR